MVDRTLLLPKNHKFTNKQRENMENHNQQTTTATTKMK